MPLLPHTAIRHFLQTTQETAVLPDGLETSGFTVPANPAVYLTGNLKNIQLPSSDVIMDPVY